MNIFLNIYTGYLRMFIFPYLFFLLVKNYIIFYLICQHTNERYRFSCVRRFKSP